jgi:hypothetical protein
MGLGGVAGPPHPLEQPGVGEELARPAGQLHEKAVLGWRQSHGLAGEPNEAALAVDLELVVSEHGRRGGRSRPPLDGPHTSQELGHVERLGHVIVRSCIQSCDALALSFFDGQHDHGHVRPGPQPANHLVPIDPWKMEIQDDEIDPGVHQQLECGLAVRRRRHFVSARLQARAHRPKDVGVVVDDEDVRGTAHCTAGSSNITVVPPPGVPSIHIRPS